MDATHANSNNPMADVLMFIGSIFCFIQSRVSAEEFRSWTWWALGMIVFIVAIVRDWKKFKAQIKDWLK